MRLSGLAQRRDALARPVHGVVGPDAVAPAVSQEAVGEVGGRPAMADRHQLVDLGTVRQSCGQGLVDRLSAQVADVVCCLNPGRHLVAPPPVGPAVIAPAHEIEDCLQ